MERVQVSWVQRLAVQRPWEPVVAAWARLSELAVGRQLSVRQGAPWVQPLVVTEAQHAAVRAEPAERPLVRQAEVVQQGEPAAPVVPSEQRLEARHEVAEPLWVAQVERPSAALSVQPSGLQERARRLAQR